MLATSSWWEPGQSGTLDVGDVSAVFMFFLAVIGSVVALSRWWLRQLRKMIHDEVEEFTKPIQPTANGGLSLPDVSRRVDNVEKILNELKETSEETRTLLIKLALKDNK
jgi:pilus assembly protein TadC